MCSFVFLWATSCLGDKAFDDDDEEEEEEEEDDEVISIPITFPSIWILQYNSQILSLLLGTSV